MSLIPGYTGWLRPDAVRCRFSGIHAEGRDQSGTDSLSQQDFKESNRTWNVLRKEERHNEKEYSSEGHKN